MVHRPSRGPDFREAEEDMRVSTQITGKQSETKDAINMLMLHTHIRTLVNGLSPEAKDTALRELVRAGVSEEVIETQLNTLAKRAPDDFPPFAVEEAIRRTRRNWMSIQRSL